MEHNLFSTLRDPAASAELAAVGVARPKKAEKATPEVKTEVRLRRRPAGRCWRPPKEVKMLVNAIKAATQALGAGFEPEVVISTHRGDTHYGGAYMATGAIINAQGGQVGVFKAAEKRGKTRVELFVRTQAGVKRTDLEISERIGAVKSLSDGLYYADNAYKHNWYYTDSTGKRFETRLLPEE
jgi:hypothetical protein